MPVKNYVKVYFTTKTIDKIKRLAEEDGVGVSEWMRYATLHYIGQVEKAKAMQTDGY